MSETNIPALPDHLRESAGVMMTTPPDEVLQRTEAIISRAVATLKTDEKGALVWVASQSRGRTSVNLAIVHKVNDNVQIVGWLGKTWGEPIEAGIAAKLTW